jgi:hypothetical protein
MTILDPDHVLAFAVQGEKRTQIAIFDPNDAVKAVHDQIAIGDPAPNRSRRDVKSFGNGKHSCDRDRC